MKEHEAKLISPRFVRPFVKGNKNDFIDDEAICETASRQSMRFIQPRTEGQQTMRAWHRVKKSLIRDKVKTTDQIHAFYWSLGAACQSVMSIRPDIADLTQFINY